MFEIGDLVVLKSDPSTAFEVVATSICLNEASVLLKCLDGSSKWLTGRHPDTIRYAEPEDLL